MFAIENIINYNGINVSSNWYFGVINMRENTTGFRERLKERGMKLTTQRQAVLDVVANHEGQHLNCEEIFDLVRGEYPDIGLATVYRTLTLLEKMELVYKLSLDDGCSRYELNNNREDHRHHHLICTKCGSVEEVEEDLLEQLEEQILQKKGFIVKDHRVKLYGYCKKCSEGR